MSLCDTCVKGQGSDSPGTPTAVYTVYGFSRVKEKVFTPLHWGISVNSIPWIHWGE